MKSPVRCILLTSLGALLTSGCSNKLIFATHTSLGLDVSGNAQIPERVSLTYNRQEFAYVPSKEDGSSHSVYGGLNADIGFFSGSTISQTFATGEAADLATQPETDDCRPEDSGPECPPPDKPGPLIFSTTSTYGLHVSFGDGQVKPSLLMGYRRSEASYIPVKPGNAGEVRSVYADILINSKPESTPETAPVRQITDEFPTGGNSARIKQSFATGKAAKNLARNNPEVRAKLDRAAGLSPASLAAKARTERSIESRVRALPEDQLAELLQWADGSFPNESEGKLAAGGSLSEFVNGFLPQLDADGLEAVAIKLNQLEN